MPDFPTKSPGRRPKNRPATGSSATSLANVLLSFASFREGLDPVRGLTANRLRELLAGTTRGEYADLMWLVAAPNVGVESVDADLYALIERRTSKLSQMNWKVVTVPEDTAGYDKTLAEEQAAAVRQTYERITDLYDLITHTALGAFRGYAFSEKLYDYSGDLRGVSMVQPWNICRVGFGGEWFYNPKGYNASGRAMDADCRIDSDSWIIHTVRQPLAPLALRKFVSGALCERDWDAFVEIYGIPGGVVIGPPNMPVDKEADYERAAEEVAQGGSGYLPNGSDYKANDGPRANSPFKERLEWLQKQLILAGTGGHLSMLEGRSGLGHGGQSQVHDQVFDTIARRDARSIGLSFNRCIDRQLLDAQFPGRPRLASWTLALDEEPTVDASADLIEKLAAAGYRVDPAKVTEITGLPVSVVSDTKPENPGEIRTLDQASNREGDADALPPVTREVVQAQERQLRPIFEALDRLPDSEKDPEGYRAALEELKERAPELLDAKPVQEVLEAAMLKAAGIAGGEAANAARRDFHETTGRIYARSEDGKFADDIHASVSKAMKSKRVMTHDVFALEDGSTVSIGRGSPGDPKSKPVSHAGGWGVSHIRAKHPDVSDDDIAHTLARGKEEPPNEAGKRLFVSERAHVVLSTGRGRGITSTRHKLHTAYKP